MTTGTRRCGFIVVLIAVSALATALSHTAFGQIPRLPELMSREFGPPPGVTRQGELEVTGVWLDGRELFKIASPTILDRSQPENQIPVEVRARGIEAKLERLLTVDTGLSIGGQAATRIEPAMLHVQTETLDGIPTLVASEAQTSRREELLGITEADSQYHALEPTELASKWRAILEQELRNALQQRQPEGVRLRILRFAAILLAALFTSVLLSKVSAILSRRKAWLRNEERRAEQEALSRAAASDAGPHRAPISHPVSPNRTETVGPTAAKASRKQPEPGLSRALQEQLSLGRRRQVVRLMHWLVSWALVLTWVVAAAGFLYQFPQARGVADQTISIPVLILIAGLIARLLQGLAAALIDHIMKAWNRSEDPQASLRVPTVSAALKGLTATVLYAFAIIGVLEYALVIPLTVLAVGAAVALALSLAAQNLVKDLVNGLLILMEDQYSLGDQIVIGDTCGTVERLNLRITQIRTEAGGLLTLPNHTVTQVENRTRLWCRADIRVTVAYAADLDRALQLARRVLEDMESNRQWAPLILGDGRVLGVEDLSFAGIVIRLQVRTPPFKRDVVERELRRRLIVMFNHEGVSIGIPQQRIILERQRVASTNDGHGPSIVRARRSLSATALPKTSENVGS